MSGYNPPTEDITSFNTLLFNQPEVQLSQAEADLLYLSKVSTDISTAGSTTFNGEVSVGGSLNAKGDLVCFDKQSPFTNTLTINQTASNAKYTTNAGTTTATEHRFTTYTTANVPKDTLVIASTGITVLEQLALNTRIIKSTLTNGNHYIFDNMVSGSTLVISTANTTNTINGSTTFNNTLTMTGGQTILCNAINGNGNTGSKSFYTLLTGTLNIGQATTTLINVKGPTTFDLDTTFTSRLNINASSYSFPFASNLSLGYYLKATGTGTTVVSATPTTILTTASIPIGVWRIDFSVINVVGAAGAGTITQAQSYVSTTNNGAVSTAVDFTGSVVRSHVSEVYGNNDVQEINGSFTYQQSTAGALYLNIVRSFSTGTYSFTGEVAITRLA